MKYKLFLILLSFSVLSVWSQTVLTGTVRNSSSGDLLSEVSCTVTDKEGNKMYAYAFTDDKGKFRLEIKSQADSVLLNFKSLGYKPEKRYIQNRSQNISVSLAESNIQLREVVVKSDPIIMRGDTITYSVNAVKREDDTFIGDVIRRLPGIEVNTSGKISYMGKSIVKFYIDGMDLLDRRYNIATNSIPVDMVQNIQVLENHQTKKMFRGKLATEDAAVNIQLKKDKRFRPVGNVSAGIGHGDQELKHLFDGISMNMGDNQQQLMTLKKNNAGTLLSSDVRSDAGFDKPSALLSPVAESTPNAVTPYTTFNDSFLGTYNHLIRFLEDDQLKVNAYYLDERGQNWNEDDTDFRYSNDSILSISRRHDLNDRKRTVNASLNFTRNGSSVYFEDDMEVMGDFRKNSDILQGTDNLIQKFHLPSFQIGNRLDYTYNVGQHYYQVKSQVRFNHLPQSGLFDWGSDSILIQHRKSKNLFLDHSFSAVRMWNQHMLQLDLQVTSQWDDQSSYLEPDYLNPSSDWINVVHQIIVKPEYEWNGKSVKLTLGVPVKEFILSHKEKSELHTHYVTVNPRFQLSWKLNNYWRFASVASYQDGPSKLNRFYNTLLYTNATSMVQGASSFGRDRQRSVTANLTFRNPYNELFSRWTVLFSQMKSNLISGYGFLGTHTITQFIPCNHENSSLSGSWNVGKLFTFWRTNMNITLGAGSRNFMQYQNGGLFERRQNNLNSMLNIETNPTKWLGLSFTEQSIGTHIQHGSTFWLHRFQAEGILSLKSFTFTTSLDYSANQTLDGSYKEFSLLSFYAKYKHNSRFTFTARCNNLFNQQEYILHSQDGINSFQEIYFLRGRTVMGTVTFVY